MKITNWTHWVICLNDMNFGGGLKVEVDLEDLKGEVKHT